MEMRHDLYWDLGRTAQPYIVTLAAKENSQGVKLSQKQQTPKTRVDFSQKTKKINK